MRADSQPATDIWGSRLGAQASRINELFQGDSFRSIDEFYDVLKLEHPRTTRGE